MEAGEAAFAVGSLDVVGNKKGSKVMCHVGAYAFFVSGKQGRMRFVDTSDFLPRFHIAIFWVVVIYVNMVVN
jgi:hypothetical protein